MASEPTVSRSRSGAAPGALSRPFTTDPVVHPTPMLATRNPAVRARMSGSRLALAALLALPPLLAHAAEPVPVRAAASATDPVSSPADTGRAAGGAQPVVPYQGAMDRADSLLKLRGGAHAEYAQLYMAWNAPWGTPGASRVRMPACDDTAGCDTLDRKSTRLNSSHTDISRMPS